jgi:hypothetical protein
MTLPNPISPQDRIINIIVRFAILALTIILWSFLLKDIRSRSSVLGAQNAPHLSQVGKVESPDRGTSFQALEFSKALCYSHSGILAKLIPGLGSAVSYSFQNYILFHTLYSNSFNIINIISQSTPKLNSVLSYPHSIHIINSRIGKQAWFRDPFPDREEILRSANCQPVGELATECEEHVSTFYSLI